MKDLNPQPGKNYSIYGENSPRDCLESLPSCAANRQPILSPILCCNLHGNPDLARRLRNISESREPRRGYRAAAEARVNGGSFMKSGTTIVTTLFAIASFPLLAQQPPPASQPSNPPPPQTTPDTEQAPQSNPATNPETQAAPMSPVNGELVSKL